MANTTGSVFATRLWDNARATVRSLRESGWPATARKIGHRIQAAFRRPPPPSGANVSPFGRPLRSRARRASRRDKLTTEDFVRDASRRSWGDIPQIHQNHNFLTTGDRDYHWIDYLRDRYVPEGRAGDLLAMGCGEGRIERLFKERGVTFTSVTGLDSSSSCIETARRLALECDLAPKVDYRVADLNSFSLPERAYDFISSFHSLHHIEALESVMASCRAALRPDGWMMVNEFVGPSRCQWTDEQLRIADEILGLLPAELRVDLGSGEPKVRNSRPTLEEMIAVAPSEAVRSAEIEGILKEYFELVEEKAWGGTINQLLFGDIAGNFDTENAHHAAIVELLIRYENTLILHGILPSDFKLYIARPRVEPKRARDPVEKRRDTILRDIATEETRGLEIGPLTKPVVTREIGSVFYVDRAPREELAVWVSEHEALDEKDLVEIDFVWRERRLKECVGEHNRFDYAVASHVIEHVPDMVTWLQELSEVLVEGGLVSLVVPDKRFTFDRLRSLTVPADLVDAHIRGLRMPSARHIYDHFSNCVELDARAAWSGGFEDRGLKPTHDHRFALERCRDAAEKQSYVGAHCSVFTPGAFLENLSVLSEIGLLDFEVASFLDTAWGSNEFFVSLRKLPSGLSTEERHRAFMASVDRVIVDGRPFPRSTPDSRRINRSEQASSVPQRRPLLLARTRMILHDIEVEGSRGLEVGPLTRPIVTREMGAVFYVDRATREELVTWYANDEKIDPREIVEVDYVWAERRLKDSIGKAEAFDYCIASHVIQHVPDMVTWLQELNEVLAEGGIVSLVVPDKRFTFDRLRSLTVPADLVDAHFRALRKPSARQIYDHFANFVEVNAAEIWSGDVDDRTLQPLHGHAFGLKAGLDAARSQSYLDVHCWVFTPGSFLENLRILSELGLLGFEIASFFETPWGTNEFFVSLRKLPSRFPIEEKHRAFLASAEKVRLS